MTKTKRLLFLLVAVLTLSIGILAITACTNSTVASADMPAVEETTESNEVEPRGVYTNVKVYIKGGGNGEVIAGAKNSFTLFPSIVRVYLYLYSSDTYQDNYANMTLMASNFIEDLNIGKSIETSASTGGEQKYWKARVRFSVDNKEWKEATTETLLYGADGILAP